MSDGKKYDQGKPRMGLIPSNAELELAKVLTFGAEKYGPDNWRKVDQAGQRYMDAALRHLNAARSGECKDSESGLSHLGHAAACVMFMLELELLGGAEGADTEGSPELTSDTPVEETAVEDMVEVFGKMDTLYLETVLDVVELNGSARRAIYAILNSRKNGTTVTEELTK